MKKLLTFSILVYACVWTVKKNRKKDAEKIAELEKKIGALESERRIHIKRMSAERNEPWVKALQ